MAGRDSSTQYWIGSRRIDHPVRQARAAASSRGDKKRYAGTAQVMEQAADKITDPGQRRKAKATVARYRKTHGV